MASIPRRTRKSLPCHTQNIECRCLIFNRHSALVTTFGCYWVSPFSRWKLCRSPGWQTKFTISPSRTGEVRPLLGICWFMCTVNYACKLCSFGARIVYLRFLIGRLSTADVAIYPQGKLSEYTDTFIVHLFGNRQSLFVCRVSSIQFTPTFRSVMTMKSFHVQYL